MVIESDEVSAGRAVIASSAHTHCARCGYRVNRPNENKNRLAALLRRYGWSNTKREGWVCQACCQRERAGLL